MTAQSKDEGLYNASAGRNWSPLELAEMKTGKFLGPIYRPKGFSSRRRIKPDSGPAWFHCMSRTTNGDFLFGPTEKEAFRRIMRRMADFCGVEILTFVVMDNHFHILAKVPDQEIWLKRFESRENEGPTAGEERLLSHLSTLYSQAYLQKLRAELASYRDRGMEDVAELLLERFKKRFCDVSLFVKELKERFTRWYNKQHDRKGTLWMERFKSVCVEGEAALAVMAAYIDLNPVRAGMVEDPMDYEWSGYGEAVAGSQRARRGLCQALCLPVDSWEDSALSRYRLFLFDQGLEVEGVEREGESKRRGVKMEARIKVIEEAGEISTAKMLRKRVKSFTMGMAVGGEGFVRRMAANYGEAMGRKRERRPREAEGKVDGKTFFVMKK